MEPEVEWDHSARPHCPRMEAIPADGIWQVSGALYSRRPS
jgi:hypothetical protein